MSGKGKPDERAAERRSKSARKNLAVADELKRFDSYYGKGGKVYIFPDVIESRVKAYRKTEKQNLHPSSQGKQSEQDQIKSSSLGIGKIRLEHTEKTGRKLKEPHSFVFDGKKLEEYLKTGQVHGEAAQLVVIERIKVTLTQITGPDDPPVFLLHNQQLGKKRNAEVDVLVLHPSLGVLVLEVMATASTKAVAHFDDAINRLLYAQNLIQEEMGDLLEKDAIVLTLALPNLHKDDADIIRKGAMGNRRMNHPEIFPLCGSTAEAMTEWVRWVEHSRVSHAFRGFTYEKRLESFKLACIRRFSIAHLRPGKSVKDSADLHHRFLLTEEQMRVRDSQAELLHISGPPGSGKTLLLAERARRWLREGRYVALAVGPPILDLLMHHLAQCVCVENVDVARFSTHKGYVDLLTWLATTPIENSVAIIVDEAWVEFAIVYAALLDHVAAGRVSGLWTAHIQPLPDWQKRTLHWFGGSTAQLSLCLRCPPHVIAWSNSVRNDKYPPLLPPPVPVTQELGVGVEVISHADHQHFQSWDNCPTCKEESTALFTNLGLLGQHVTSAVSLSDVVVITTNGSCDRDRVAAWLRNLGLHAVAEQTWGHSSPVLQPGVTPSSRHQAEDEALRSRVCMGLDVTGRPVIHVVGHKGFQGLEKPVVLLWHEEKNVSDWDFDTRDLEEDKPWDYTLSQHQSSWFLAASRCRGRLVAMVTTPSPLLSMLPSTSVPKRETQRPSPEAGDKSSTPRQSERDDGSGEKIAPGDTTLKWTSPNAEFHLFDNIYNKKGKVQVFPDILAPKVTLFKKEKPERRLSSAEKLTKLRRSRKERIPTTDTDSRAMKTSGDFAEEQQWTQKEGEKGSIEKHPQPFQDDIENSRGRASTQQAEARVLTSGEQVQTEEKREERIKIREPYHFVLNEEKLRNVNVIEQMRAEECEVLTLLRMKEALEEISKPDDASVFVLHNQNLSVTIEGKLRTKSEQDVLIIHPKLGILLLEVKAVKASTSFSRFDIATEQLLRAQEFVLEEMGDLLEDDAIVLTIALPELQPEDSDDIRNRAQELSSRERRHGVTADTPASADKMGESGGPGQGNVLKFKGTALLGDHPEIYLLCGCTAEVFREWVGWLRQQRLKSGHAFKGANDAERLDNFKRACIRRFSFAGLRPGQSVKESADLHHRFLLTEEQLRIRDSQAELLHISGPPGSGKTLLLAERARRWLREGRHVALAVGLPIHNLLLRHLARTVCGNKADAARISVHRGYKDLLMMLDTVSTESPVSIIVDEASAIIPGFHAELLDHVRAERVHCLWTADTRRLSDEQERALQGMGGSTVELQLCLRCPPHIMAWTNSVRNEENPPLLPPPVPVTRELGVEVVVISHADHPQSQPWYICSCCKSGASAFFSSLGLQGDHSTCALTLSDVVVITTVLSCERDSVAQWLCGLGVRAVAETTHGWATPVLPPGAMPQTRDEAENQARKSRVSKGLDVEGRPVVHVVGCEDFKGLEKPVVLLWHEDRNDDDRNDEDKSDEDRYDYFREALQQRRAYRLQRHRLSWFLAASRCQGRLLVMAATPSPLLSLLPSSSSPDLRSQLRYLKLSSGEQQRSRSSGTNPSDVIQEETQSPPSPSSAPLPAAPASEKSSSVHPSTATLPSRPPSSFIDCSEAKTSETVPKSSVRSEAKTSKSFSSSLALSAAISPLFHPSSSAPSRTISSRSLPFSSAHSGDSSSDSISPFASSSMAIHSRLLPPSHSHAWTMPSQPIPSSPAASQAMPFHSFQSFPHGGAMLSHPFPSSPALSEASPFHSFPASCAPFGTEPSEPFPLTSAPSEAMPFHTFMPFSRPSRVTPSYHFLSSPAALGAMPSQPLQSTSVPFEATLFHTYPPSSAPVGAMPPNPLPPFPPHSGAVPPNPLPPFPPHHGVMPPYAIPSFSAQPFAPPQATFPSHLHPETSSPTRPPGQAAPSPSRESRGAFKY